MKFPMIVFPDETGGFDRLARSTVRIAHTAGRTFFDREKRRYDQYRKGNRPVDRTCTGVRRRYRDPRVHPKIQSRCALRIDLLHAL